LCGNVWFAFLLGEMGRPKFGLITMLKHQEVGLLTEGQLQSVEPFSSFFPSSGPEIAVTLEI
jgi:hypothetical protein